ncbi:MAG: hypothetical protein AAGG51_28790 [Cyanobacteria bacterium P01_G01_bin.54]
MIIASELLARWRSQIQLQGEIKLPCLPRFQQQTFELVSQLLEQFGQPIKPEQYQQLQTSIEKLIAESFVIGPYAHLTIAFQSKMPPEVGITCDLATTIDTIPLPDLGRDPDAKVLTLAAQWNIDKVLLALGSGLGRNVSPLLDQGYRVETWEWRLPRALHGAQSLPTHSSSVTSQAPLQTQHLLDPLARLEPAKYSFIFAPDLAGAIGQTSAALRLLLAKVSDGLISGGQFLLGLWLSDELIEPELQEWLQWQGHWILTLGEIEQLQSSLPLQLLSCESTLAYERSQRGELDPNYRAWLAGKGLNLSPEEQADLQLHWLVWQRL